jgi:hypothetical protein
MTDEEESLLDDLCEVRSHLKEQINGFQTVLEKVDDLAIKLLIYLLYKGNERIEE